jgi:ESCRT-I complex subunit TSG101
MASTYAALQNEHANLNALSSTLSSNNAILSSSLRRADTSISTARQRATAGDIPKVDEMVTAPTVVGRQLYDVVCEERGVEAAIWALQEGFVRGRIGSDVWAKQTRNLAREGFRKRYLAKKVGRGMGLDMHGLE